MLSIKSATKCKVNQEFSTYFLQFFSGW